MFNYKKLKELREAHDMTQKEAARRLNIEASTLSNYERGTRKPTHEFLMAYCEIFNVPKEALNTLFYDAHISDGLDAYEATKTDTQPFVILDPDKLKTLNYTERLMIKEYAEYIYSKHMKNSKKRR